MVSVADGSEVAARGVVLATGVTYRRIEVPSLLALAGKGVFYGTSNSEVRALRGHHVHVVGGGNSAGQAAMQLRRFASRVTLVVREPDLSQCMSHYLRREVEAAANVDVRLGSEVIGASGEGRLERLTVRDNSTGATASWRRRRCSSSSAPVRIPSGSRRRSRAGRAATF